MKTLVLLLWGLNLWPEVRKQLTPSTGRILWHFHVYLGSEMFSTCLYGPLMACSKAAQGWLYFAGFRYSFLALPQQGGIRWCREVFCTGYLLIPKKCLEISLYLFLLRLMCCKAALLYVIREENREIEGRNTKRKAVCFTILLHPLGGQYLHNCRHCLGPPLEPAEPHEATPTSYLEQQQGCSRCLIIRCLISWSIPNVPSLFATLSCIPLTSATKLCANFCSLHLVLHFLAAINKRGLRVHHTQHASCLNILQSSKSLLTHNVGHTKTWDFFKRIRSSGNSGCPLNKYLKLSLYSCMQTDQ